VFRLERGRFGFVDSAGARYNGTQLLVPEMTLKAGAVMWDTNGRAATDWQAFPYQRESWKQP
jgi:dihydroorotase